MLFDTGDRPLAMGNFFFFFAMPKKGKDTMDG